MSRRNFLNCLCGSELPIEAIQEVEDFSKLPMRQ